MDSFSRFARVLPLFVLGSPALAQCPEWVSNFASLSGGVEGAVYAQIVFDDGSGPALYLGGSFTNSSNSPTAAISHLARWSGSRFEQPPGGAPNAVIDSFGIFDDGSGPALYAGGEFTAIGGVPALRIARWNGTPWSALGSGLDSAVNAICVYDSGYGPALYAGGAFMHSGATPMRGVARWDGTAWNSVGDVVGTVNALTVFDDGSGAKLYAGGSFIAAGGNALGNVARFDGANWSAVDGGTNGTVYALHVHDDGAGPRLFAAGAFTRAGGNPALRVAKFDGASWSAPGSGLGGTANALDSFDTGSGSKLIAAGAFTSAGGSPAGEIAAWDGTSWSSLSSATSGSVSSLCAYDEGAGARLFASGTFSSIGGHAADNIARLSGATWQPVGAGQPPDGNVYAFERGDVGDGPKLYVGGSFVHVGLLAANDIAAWDGSHWSSLGTGLDGVVSAMCFYTDGSNPVLYVAGGFAHAGGIAASGIAGWAAGAWHALGSLPINVNALAMFDDGSGPALYAGGDTFNSLRKWNGASWLPVGNFAGTGGPEVDALKVWNDGTGSALYAAGRFHTIDGTTVNNVAKWNGSSWAALGTGMTETNAVVLQLEVFDDGSGAALYAAGGFSQAGGVSSGAVARWNGTSWSSLTPTPVIPISQLALRAVNDSSGPALYSGGLFQYILNGVDTNLARWDGTAWTSLGPNPYGEDVVALGSYDDGSGHGVDVLVGHTYPLGNPPNAAFLAEHRTCAASITPFCYGDGGQIACPCSNSGAPGHGCDNSSFTGGALLVGSGSTEPDTVVITTSGTKPSVLTILLQGSASSWPGVNFGDGVRCAGGTLKRLYTKAAVGGVVTVPGPGDPSITARSAALGFPISPVIELYYQTHYRDPSATFCPAPQGNTWNVSNGAAIRW
jgi:hypothetical protein